MCSKLTNYEQTMCILSCELFLFLIIKNTIITVPLTWKPLPLNETEQPVPLHWALPQWDQLDGWSEWVWPTIKNNNNKHFYIHGKKFFNYLCPV